MGLLLVFNVGTLGLIVLFSLLLVKGPQRVTLIGWICAAVNIAVFAAPLSIIVRTNVLLNFCFNYVHVYKLYILWCCMQRQVIRTKSVEYMPFTLSLSLTLCATMWFLYGFFINDFYIAVSFPK